MGRTAAALARLLVAQGQHIEDRLRDAHLATADRVFAAIGPMAAPVQVIHDAIGAGVHATVRQSLGLLGALGTRAAAQLDEELVAASPVGRATVAAVLGLVGDTMRDVEPDLDWPTALVRDGEIIATAGHGLPDPLRSREVVVLLHGLCESESAWGWGTDLTRPSLPDRLAAPERVVLLARVNSGRRPAEVGAEVAHLLAALDSAAVERVVLVGHSMGGLVGRAALRSAVTEGYGWVERCDTLITLGTPHLGAPLEKAVEVLVRAGSVAREVDAITGWFDQRSAGIRDLRHGTITADDAPGQRVAAVRLPDHVTMHTVGGSLRSPVLAAAVGDGMVRHNSAHAVGLAGQVATRRGPVLHLTGRSHFDMLADPEIGEHVARLIDAS